MKSLDDFIMNIKITESWKIILIPIVFMAVDYLTGFFKAYIHHNICSSKMRDGLIKKCGECVVVALSLFCEYMISLPHDFVTFVTVYIIILESISILENLESIGVKLPSWITKHLKDYIDEETNHNE